MTLSVIQGSNRSLETLHRKTNKKKDLIGRSFLLPFGQL